MERIRTYEEARDEALHIIASAITRDEFYDIFLDLIERAYYDIEEGCNIDDVIDEAIDTGLIYSDDEWEVYRHYCDIGESANIMYEWLHVDIYHCIVEFIKEA